MFANAKFDEQGDKICGRQELGLPPSPPLQSQQDLSNTENFIPADENSNLTSSGADAL